MKYLRCAMLQNCILLSQSVSDHYMYLKNCGKQNFAVGNILRLSTKDNSAQS